MKKIKPSSLWIALLTTIFLSSFFYGQVENRIKDKVEYKLKQWIKDNKIPGVSIAFKKKSFYYENSFGFADIENKVPARPFSSYQIASTTKPMTAIAILKLWEMGKIDLNEELQTFYPYFPKKKHPINIHQLLTHTSGISHYKTDDKDEKHIKEPYTTKMAIDIFKDWELLFEPGTSFKYSSYGYNLLGAIIEATSGSSYEEFLKQHIWEPAGMTNTSMDNPSKIVPNRVRGYTINNGIIQNAEYLNISSRFAAGGVRSTVGDLIKMGTALINGKILKPNTLRLMFTPYSDQGWNEYGLGFSVKPYNGQHTIMHSGGMPQTSFLFIAAPYQEIYLSLASNLGRVDIESIGLELMQLISNVKLPTPVTSKDQVNKLVLFAMNDVLNFGQGYYQRVRTAGFNNGAEIRKAFSYFNKYVNMKLLKKELPLARARIESGHKLHPKPNFSWDILGGYMSMKLGRSYSSEGAISFFSDYITLYKTNKSIPYRFNKAFERLVSLYKKEWNSLQNSELSNLKIDSSTNWKTLKSVMDKELKGNVLFPDIYKKLTSYAFENALFKKNPATLRSIIDIMETFYPDNFSSAFLNGLFFLKQGNKKDSAHWMEVASERGNQIRDPYWIGRQILKILSKDLELGLSLGEVAIHYNPNSILLLGGLGEVYIDIGQKEKARIYINRALKIEPKNQELLNLLKTINDK